MKTMMKTYSARSRCAVKTAAKASAFARAAASLAVAMAAVTVGWLRIAASLVTIDISLVILEIKGPGEIFKRLATLRFSLDAIDLYRAASAGNANANSRSCYNINIL